MDHTWRLYTDLSWLWPMWGDAETDYAAYCRHLVRLIRQYAQHPVGTLLNIGCGGGKNLYHLKNHYKVTGLDVSPTMLAQAKTLNPECEFIQGDMRSFKLGRTFDAILMDDAISHMHCRADFTATFQTAFDHLNPGGILIATPDLTTETFEQNKTITFPASPQKTPDGLDVVFIENVYDPDPEDEHYETTIVYLIRDKGHLRMETDHWTMGLFSLDTWRSVLHKTGFSIHENPYMEGNDKYTIFICIKAT